MAPPYKWLVIKLALVINLTKMFKLMVIRMMMTKRRISPHSWFPAPLYKLGTCQGRRGAEKIILIMILLESS